MLEDSDEFYWDVIFVKVCGYFSAPIDHQLIEYWSLMPCHRSTSRSKTNSFVSLDTNSYNHPKSLRTCSFYLLGLRHAVKVKIEIIPLYLKDTRRMNLLACWKWCIRRMFMHCSYTLIFFYLWTFDFDRAGSLISGTKFELHLKKEEWVSVLKLSTIWNMTKVCRTWSLWLDRLTLTFIDQIRQYAIHWLSTNVTLSPIEKIFLARAHTVGAWLNEGVTGLATCDPMPTLEDLAVLGWETAARFFWMRCNFHPNSSSQYTLRFRRDAIKCPNCSSSSSLIDDSYPNSCGHIASEDAELAFSGSASPISGTFDFLVPLRQMKCPICNANPFLTNAFCRLSSCRTVVYYNSNVRVSTLNKLIEEMFGEEIKDCEPSLLDSS